MPSKCYPCGKLTEDKLVNCGVWPPEKTDIQSGQAAFAVISAAVAAIPLNFFPNPKLHSTQTFSSRGWAWGDFTPGV